MTLSCITGNKDKFTELEAMLGIPLTQVVVHLPEIQSLDAHEVIRAKLAAARSQVDGPLIVEDTSLYLACLGDKLPGPFVKWFEEAIGNEGIVSLAHSSGNTGARAATIIGFYDPEEGIEHLFEGEMDGRIVASRGDQDFGWGPIFELARTGQTYSEMTREEKYRLSMRAQAAQKLKEFLRGSR